jgi:hypothetical protein
MSGNENGLLLASRSMRILSAVLIAVIAPMVEASPLSQEANCDGPSTAVRVLEAGGNPRQVAYNRRY